MPQKSAPTVSREDASPERRLQEVRELLPELGQDVIDAAVDPQSLAKNLAAQMSALPVEQRRQIRRRLAIAIGDVESLIVDLQGELDAVRDDLQSLNQHSSAAQAYCRGTGMARQS